MSSLEFYVPATPDGLHHSTIPALLRAGVSPRVVPMLEVESYYWLLAGLWAERRTFAIVEHDIEVTAEQLRQLETCGSWWCAYSYEVYAGDLATAYGGPFGLGCVRFRAPLLEHVPEALDLAAEANTHPIHADRSYAVMDSTLTQVLRSHRCDEHHRGVPACLHLPNVTHHHRYLRENAFTGGWPAIR